MLSLDTLVGIAAFSLMLPAFVLQLLSMQNAEVRAADAYALALSANSRLQSVAVLSESGNLAPGQLEGALRALFGDSYAVWHQGQGGLPPESLFASRAFTVDGDIYYIGVNLK